MDDADRRQAIARFGISHVNVFVHPECVNALGGRGPDRGKVIAAIAFLKPGQVIGRWIDVTACDHCHRGFAVDDAGYLRITLTSLEELSSWIDVLEGERQTGDGKTTS
jgi:hypothetical protein